MKIYLTLLFIFVINASCFSQFNNFNKVRITAYPSSGSTEGYEILVDKDILTINIKKIYRKNDSLIFGEILKSQTKKLKKKQAYKIQRNLIFMRNVKIEFDRKRAVLDSWYLDLYLNDVHLIYIHKGILHRFKYFDELLRYIIKISPLEVNLRGFA